MNRRELASVVANIEGKKSQVKVCDIREILKILRNLISADPTLMKLFLK